MQEFEGIDLKPDIPFTLSIASYFMEIIATRPSGTGLKAVFFCSLCEEKIYILLTDAGRADTGL
jgi:hypothetical protein